MLVRKKSLCLHLSNYLLAEPYVGEGNGTPLQHSCLENPMDGTAWWAAVHGVAKSQTRLHFHFHFSLSCIGEGNGNPLKYSCLEDPRDGGAWWAAVCGVAQSLTQRKRLSSSGSSRTVIIKCHRLCCIKELYFWTILETEGPTSRC